MFLYLAPVNSINENCQAHFCMSDKQFSEHQARFLKHYLQIGVNVFSMPESMLGNCGAVSPNSLIIDPLGDLYKCWDEIGIQEKKSGSIFSSEKLTPRYYEWIDYPMAYFDECKECQFLPICMSGCPYMNREKNKMSCHSIKYNYKDFIFMLKNKNSKVNEEYNL